MRNLKKVLSLALALVMLLGMMVVGAGAATSFKDDDKIDNQVAVAVSNKIGVLVGDENGNFNPDGTLTRAEAAVAIARLDLGTSAANALAATNAATFKDVPVTHWGKPYIDYCAGNGYIVGDGNGNFNPNKTVSSVEFATMVSRMLGYDTKVEGIEGNADWAVKAAALARKAGLSTNVLLSTDTAMTRDDMAQMVFNSLTSSLVEYEGLNVSVNGVSLTSNVKVRTHTGSQTASGNRYTYNGEIIRSNITPIRLCEEKFPDLRLASDEDAFGRVESVWTWKNVNIAGSEQVVAANFEFTEKKSTVSLSGATGDSETLVYVDGRIQDTKNTTINAAYVAGLTHNGRLVQVFLDDSDYKNIDKVVVINTYVGQVSAVNSAKETVTISAKTKVSATADSYGTKTEVTPVSTYETTDLAVGDIVAYTAAYASDGKYYIETADAITPTVTGVLTKWNGKSVIDTEKGKADSNFTVDGETYKYSVNNRIDDEDGNDLSTGGNGIAEFTVNKSEINVYLDKYNFALYVSGVESEKNYAAVIGVGSSNTHGSETRGATLLFPDGTTKEVTAQMSDWSVMSAIDHVGTGTDTTAYTSDDLDSVTSGSADDKNLVTDGVADIVTYTVGDNDVYKLTLVGDREITLTGGTKATVYSGKYDMSTMATPGTAGTPGVTATTFTTGKSEIKLSSRYDLGSVAAVADNTANETYYTTSKTIFMIATQKSASNPFGGRNYNVYTGYANAPTFDPAEVKGVAFATNRQYKTQIDVVYVDAVKMSNIAGAKTYFVLDGSDIITTDEGKYYELPAVVDGELTTIKIDAQASAKWNKNGTKSGVNIGLNTADKGLYAIDSVGKNSKGIIETCERVDFAPSASGTGTVQDRYDVLGIGSTISGASTVYWSCANDAKFFYVNKDLELSAIELKDIVTDNNDKVWGMLNGTSTKVTTAFVCEVENTTGDVVTPPVTDTGDTYVAISDSNVPTVYYKSGTTQPTVDEADALIIAKLESLGYDVTSIEDKGTTVEYNCTKDNGRTAKFTWTKSARLAAYVGKVDTKDVWISVAADSNNPQLKQTNVLNGETISGTYAKVTTGTGLTSTPSAGAFVAVSGTGVVVTGNGFDVSSGYYQIAPAADVAEASAAQIGSSTGTYSYTTAAGTGTIEKWATDGNFYGMTGATITMTFKLKAADLASNVDTITVTAANMTGTKTAQFAKASAAGAEQVVTLTVGTDNQTTITVGGTTAAG